MSAAPLASHQRALAAQQLRDLLKVYEDGEDARFDDGIDTLMRERHEALFGKVARLTRELHNAVTHLSLDERLARISGDEMPDARNRLDYVMQVTEKAAHRTLDLVDQARGVADAVRGVVATLGVHCAAPGDPTQTEMIGSVRDELVTQETFLRSTLSDLAQAQEYQDISGQIIKKVITLVCNVEAALLDLLRATGDDAVSPRVAPKPVLSDELAGPTLPGTESASQHDADELLASLGF